jgi:anti-sigma factor RsiW
VKCDELRVLLTGYTDGELDLVHSLEIEQHLAGCAACSQVVEQQQALRRTLGNPALYHQAPVELRERIRSSLRLAHRRQRVLPVLPWQALTVAASLAVLALLAWGLFSLASRSSAEETLAQELVAGHIRSLMASHLLDVQSSDQHTVKPWFSGKVDFAPPVKDLAADGYPLVGGRLDFVNNRKIAVLVYKRHQHPINVFIWPATSEADTAIQRQTRQGYHLFHWTKGGLTYWVVSDLNEEELGRFVELFQR